MVKLDLNSICLQALSNSSFASNLDISSPLGFINILCDKLENFNVHFYSPYKSRLIVRSVLGGEVYEFADAFDALYIIKRDIELILCIHNINSVHRCVYSKCTLEAPSAAYFHYTLLSARKVQQ